PRVGPPHGLVTPALVTPGLVTPGLVTPGRAASGRIPAGRRLAATGASRGRRRAPGRWAHRDVPKQLSRTRLQRVQRTEVGDRTTREADRCRTRGPDARTGRTNQIGTDRPRRRPTPPRAPAKRIGWTSRSKPSYSSRSRARASRTRWPSTTS